MVEGERLFRNCWDLGSLDLTVIPDQSEKMRKIRVCTCAKILKIKSQQALPLVQLFLSFILNLGQYQL